MFIKKVHNELHHSTTHRRARLLDIQARSHRVALLQDRQHLPPRRLRLALPLLPHPRGEDLQEEHPGRQEGAGRPGDGGALPVHRHAGPDLRAAGHGGGDGDFCGGEFQSALLLHLLPAVHRIRQVCLLFLLL